MMDPLMALAAAALVANPVADAPRVGQSATKDINRKVCKDVELSGSRFNKKRVCMSEAEWKNAQQADRDLIDRIQQSTCVRGAGC